MLQAAGPLREKLTLFWHNHFATSLAKVQDSTLMFRQNCLLRGARPGRRFGPLSRAISRDGAMLDVASIPTANVKGKPNENYGPQAYGAVRLGVATTPRTTSARPPAPHRLAHRRKASHSTPRVSTTTDPSGPRADRPGTAANVGRIVLEQPSRRASWSAKLYYFLVSGEDRPADSLLEPLCDSYRKKRPTTSRG